MSAVDDLYFLRAAYKAAELSPDPSTQNGAVLVRNGVIVAQDCNRPPTGVRFDPAIHDRDWRYEWFQHAERGVIITAASMGIPTAGCTMYCPFFACKTCAQAIIDGGIALVVGHRDILDRPRRNNCWAAEIRDANEKLAEAGVATMYLEGPVNGVRIRFDEQAIHP